METNPTLSERVMVHETLNQKQINKDNSLSLIEKVKYSIHFSKTLI